MQVCGGPVAGAPEVRGPQSVQSAPYPQAECSAPGPPSSQKPSEVTPGPHVSEQRGGGGEGEGGGGEGEGGGGEGGGGEGEGGGGEGGGGEHVLHEIGQLVSAGV